MPNMRRYDFENPPPDPADDDGFVYFEPDDNYDDEYDRYEDAYLDTGYDPYSLFDDEKAHFSIVMLKWRVLRVLRGLKHDLRYRIDAKYRASCDDIPF